MSHSYLQWVGHLADYQPLLPPHPIVCMSVLQPARPSPCQSVIHLVCLTSLSTVPSICP